MLHICLKVNTSRLCRLIAYRSFSDKTSKRDPSGDQMARSIYSSFHSATTLNPAAFSAEIGSNEKVGEARGVEVEKGGEGLRVTFTVELNDGVGDR